jgi:sugar phosphate isomerase/epimerase
MLAPRIAVQTKCLEKPLRQALHTARQLEAEGVQLDLRQELPAAELSDTAHRQLRKLLDDLNLRVGSTAFPTRRGYGNPENLERRIDASVEAMRASSRLGARTMLITVGAIPLADEADRSTLLEALTTLAMHGNRLGVQPSLQAVNADPADLKNLIDELPDGLVGVDLSPADAILAGQNPRQVAETLGRHITHVFANDAVRGLGGANGNEVELGRGTADFPELLGVLEEHDYHGWITVERRDSRRPVDELANAIQFLRAM